MLTIDIAIATHGDRIDRVEKMLLPQMEGVRYVVSWQEGGLRDIPSALTRRPDVEVCRIEVRGVARNRNNAIDHCRGDIVIMGDDDLEYTEEGILGVREAYQANPEMCAALFKVDFPNPKPYPESNCRLGLPFPKGYWVSMVEVTFRRKSFGNLRCHPMLGLGAIEFQSGEDEMLIISAIKRGLDCRFINHRLAIHPGESTGSKVSPGILMGQGVIASIIYPRSYFPRLVMKAWRLKRNHGAEFYKSLRQLMTGARRKNSVLSCPRRYKW